jgi:starch phosphorylase
MPVAYLSAEIGLHSDLHTYSGGLGVLAGDHVKSAADASIDLVGVSLLYRQGYGRQHLDPSGNQTETYPEIDPNDHLQDTGVDITLPLDGTDLHAKVWSTELDGATGGSVTVYFLDTRHERNTPEHARLGDRLYGGDHLMRIRQEYLLGVGGVRALDALGITIDGLHLNEGHCTFAALEMLRRGWSRDELAERTLFTTHTPVPAGHDRFPWTDVEVVLGDLLPLDAKALSGDDVTCSMSHLGIAMAGAVNAVSKLNAEVAMTMFPHVEIHPITNGVHHLTWTGGATAALFDTHLGGWKTDPSVLQSAASIPSSALRLSREQNRAALRDLVLTSTGVTLHADRLTIGFARRFATYKRANLVFSDLERLRRIGGGKIQFVFSGKAHPKDEGGKDLIRSVFEGAEAVANEIPVAFIEDYSMATGLAMTSGVDVWLNNPIRPMEASGTSGMKAAMNGVPNLSILDGWWPEACLHGVNGWAIGAQEDDRDDERDVNALYAVLEHEVLPMWTGNREAWDDVMRHAMVASAGFTGHRMIQDYMHFYGQFRGG